MKGLVSIFDIRYQKSVAFGGYALQEVHKTIQLSIFPIFSKIRLISSFISINKESVLDIAINIKPEIAVPTSPASKNPILAIAVAAPTATIIETATPTAITTQDNIHRHRAIIRSV